MRFLIFSLQPVLNNLWMREMLCNLIKFQKARMLNAVQIPSKCTGNNNQNVRNLMIKCFNLMHK